MRKGFKIVGVLLFALILCGLMKKEAFAAENLLVNGNAEDGMNGWVDPDGIWYPSNVVTAHEGANFFWPSKKSCEISYIYQDVNVTGYQAGQWMRLTGWLANWDQSPNDQSILHMQFLDASGKVLDSKKSSQRNPQWREHMITMQIPSGAVIARVKLEAKRFVGSDNDAYFDELSLVVLDGTSYNTIIISGKDKADVGKKIQLVANNGITHAPENFEWSSSYDSFATVDAKGRVTILVKDEVVIYAKDKSNGMIQGYYINSDVKNPSIAPAKVTKLKAVKKSKTYVKLQWKRQSKVSGYNVYIYRNKKWVKLKTITKNKTVTYTVKKLKKGKQYKFKVEAFQRYGDMTYAGKAATLTVKTKK